MDPQLVMYRLELKALSRPKPGPHITTPSKAGMFDNPYIGRVTVEADSYAYIPRPMGPSI